MTTKQYHHIINKDLTDIVGINVLEPAEQEAFIAQIGETIFDSALTQLIAHLSKEQVDALEYYLEDEPSMELLLKHLFDHYPQFEDILVEEIVAFKEETVSLFGSLEADTGIPATV